MLGAIVGDVIGSSYEAIGAQKHLTPMKDYNFDLFVGNTHKDYNTVDRRSRWTDDTICTLAVAETLLYPEVYKYNFNTALLHWCRRHPNAGYGGYFRKWMNSDHPQPYNSFGNGSAMRVSPVGFAFSARHVPEVSQRLVRLYADASAAPTHNHPEGVKGAQAVAVAIAMADAFTDTSVHQEEYKTIIKDQIELEFGYDLSTPLEVIRPTYTFDTTCPGSVPQAIRAFLESTDFESAIRLAVSLGGDTDTQAAMAGGIAHAFYKKIPDHIVASTFERLEPYMINLILNFHQKYAIPF